MVNYEKTTFFIEIYRMYTLFKLIKKVPKNGKVIFWLYYILKISQYLFENIYFLNVSLGLAVSKE